MTTPGYPIFGTHAKYYGGTVHNLPLLEKNDFLPDLDSIPADVLAKAKALVINYPNNPTGASATPEFFAKVVAFARKNNLVVIHDAAYAALVFEGKPLSTAGDARSDGRRGRAALDEQGLQHDGLAAGLCRGQPADRQGLRGCQGQHRLGAVPGNPGGVRVVAGPPGDHAEDRGQVQPADGRAGQGPQQVRLRGDQAQGVVLPVCSLPEGGDQQGWHACDVRHAPRRSASG